MTRRDHRRRTERRRPTIQAIGWRTRRASSVRQLVSTLAFVQNRLVMRERSRLFLHRARPAATPIHSQSKTSRNVRGYFGRPRVRCAVWRSSGCSCARSSRTIPSPRSLRAGCVVARPPRDGCFLRKARRLLFSFTANFPSYTAFKADSRASPVQGFSHPKVQAPRRAPRSPMHARTRDRAREWSAKTGRSDQPSDVQVSCFALP
jgi:hypothetical protein